MRSYGTIFNLIACVLLFFNPVSLRAQTEFSEGSGSNGILLVPVCLSAMLITLGSILIELVFIVLGQSAAIAASLAIDKEIAVQQLNYYELKKVLLNGKQRLQLALFSCPWDKFRMGLPKIRHLSLTGDVP